MKSLRKLFVICQVLFQVVVLGQGDMTGIH